MPDWGLLHRREAEMQDVRTRVDRACARQKNQDEAKAPRKQKENKSLEESNEHLTLFRTQDLIANGDIFIKNSRFSRSRKYFAELRGCTIGVFRSQSYGENFADKHIDGVITALPVHKYNIEATASDDMHPRIYLTPKKGSEHPLIYVRVSDGEEGLQQWCNGLGRLMSTPMPLLSDLRVESVIGRGGGGKVFLAIWERNKKAYALKVIEKAHTFKSARAFRHVSSERFLMEKAGDHPYLLPMEFAFQSDMNLYIGTPFCVGGDLASYIRNNGTRRIPYDGGDYVGAHPRRYARLSEAQTRRMASEILVGLEHLHRRGIVYRDLKPENVFIDEEGHLKIGDYGLSKLLTGRKNGMGRGRTASICGTRNYLPPEMLHGQAYSFESDLWSFGVMLYRMLVGSFPFDAARTREVFHRIKVETPRMPKWLSPAARQMLRGLLQKEARRRVGIGQLKRMEFFTDVEWDAVAQRRGERCVDEVISGTQAVDALENFELSKLYGITLGELVGPTDEDEDEVEEIAQHRKEVRELMIGFEYVRRRGREQKPKTLEVKETNGNLFRKLASIDIVSPLVSPRKK